MPKIAFIGAGSSVFVKNVLGDCMLTPSLQGLEFALYDMKMCDELFEANQDWLPYYT